MVKFVAIKQLFFQYVLFATLAGLTFGTIYPYKACPFFFPLKIQIFVKDGKCTESSHCNALVNCTTFRGSIIVREAIANNINTTIPARFPALREITGFLVIVYFRKPLDFDLFPNLAVVRGKQQIVHYSLVFYHTFLERVGLPSLTVVKSGGVRFDHNSQMCYLKTMKWSSIVLEKEHTKENFGISLYKNNENCYDKCLDNRCIAPSGHDSTRHQYCYGPGNTTYPECQKLCKASCGSHGCLDGTMDECCHSECLGGCSKSGSDKHCFACMNYRSSIDGKCVTRCPPGQYIVYNFECRFICPITDRFVHQDKCVNACPAGYIRNFMTRRCDKCETSRCPRDCTATRKDGYKLDGLSSVLELTGCTNIKSNLEIEIRAGPSNIMQKLEESLGKIQEIDGYLYIYESEVITSLSFLKSLGSIKNSLSNHTYALLIMGNSKLKSLWRPNSLKIGHGNVLIHGNINLCHPEIDFFNKSTNFLHKGTLSVSQNGYLCPGDLKKFNISVHEKHCGYSQRGEKCVQVMWYHDRNVDSRSTFFVVHYKISNWTVGAKVVAADNCNNRWCRKDIDIPEPTINELGKIKVFANISNLLPYTTYKFFVEMYSLETGNGRKSHEAELRLSESVPGVLVGLKAAYLSPSELEVSWQPPERPNGIITQYRIFYQRKNYSFWNSKLNWCSRNVAASVIGRDISVIQNRTSSFCRVNLTDACAIQEKESRIIKEDKNFVLFRNMFENELIGAVFEKEEDDDLPIKSKNSSNKQSTTIATPLCQSNGTHCNSRTSVTQSIPMASSPRLPLTFSPKAGFAQVDGRSLNYVIRNLTYFQEYNIQVCPCTTAGCVQRQYCPIVFGQTDASSTADNIPNSIRVHINNDEYRVNWTAPSKPNGVILMYDIRIRNNQNEEKRRCILGYSQTTFVEKGAAPGNYSIRIQAITPAGNGTWSQPAKFKIEKPSEAKSYNAVVVGVSITAAVLLLLLFGAFPYISHVRRKARMNIPSVLYTSDHPDCHTSNDVYVPDEWEVPRNKIELSRELGKGSFGMVFEGIAHSLVDSEPRLRVAVKTVKEGATVRERIDFLKEASIMKAFECYHIVKLLGIVSQGEPTLVVMELMERGDLKGFLRSRRPGTSNSMEPVSLAEILQMAAEIADGMSYLAARKFVHRDLAARNCMVTANFTVKIGDFGMTRDVYDNDYYRKGGKGLMPVRWMAPESLYDGIFTVSSDVWSYGIVLWEMATLAAQPYPGKSNEDVLSFVIDGGILEQPADCPDRLYNMMCNCWKMDPRARPSFLEIVQFLENDVSDQFAEVSYYHEMKRRLMELTNSNIHGPEQSRMEQTRCSMLCSQDEASSLEAASPGDWMTEADRDIGCQVETCQGTENAGYNDSINDEKIRYVQFPMK